MKTTVRNLFVGLLFLSSIALNAITVSVTNLTGFSSKTEMGKVISFELQKGAEFDETAERIISTGLKPEESMAIAMKEGGQGDYIFLMSEGSKFSLSGEKNKTFSLSLQEGDQIYVVTDAHKGFDVMKFPWGMPLVPISVTNSTKNPLEVMWVPGKIREADLKGKGAWSKNIAPGQTGLFVAIVGEPYSIFAQGSHKKGQLTNTVLTGNIVLSEDKKNLSFMMKESPGIKEQLKVLQEKAEEIATAPEAESAEELP